MASERKPGRKPMPISPQQRLAIEALVEPIGRPNDPDGPAPALTLDQVADELNKRQIPPRTPVWGLGIDTDTKKALRAAAVDMRPGNPDIVERMLADADAKYRQEINADALGSEIADPDVRWTGSAVRSAVKALRRQRLD